MSRIRFRLWTKKICRFAEALFRCVTFGVNYSDMIQRIQSLFLFLVDIVLIVLLFVPFMTTSMPDMGEMSIGFTLLDYPTLIVGQAVLCVIAAAALAMFRNRKLQMRLCIAGMVLSVIFSGFLAAVPMLLNDAGVNGVCKSAPGTWISLANFLLFFLAWRFVKKDDELVKSTDRIR